MLKKKKNPFLEQFTLYSVLHKFNYDLPDIKDVGDTQTHALHLGLSNHSYWEETSLT